MHVDIKLKYALYAALVIALFMILAGASTYLFAETNGVVFKATKSKVSKPGYTSGSGSRGYDGGKKTILTVSYTYLVDNKRYKSSLVNLWFISSSKDTHWEGQKLRVFYVPFYPKIAVLKKGPDVLLFILMVAAMFGGWFVRSYFRKHYLNA